MMESEDSDLLERKPSSSNQPPLPEVMVRGDKGFKYRITVEPLIFAIFFADSLADSVTINLVLTRTCEIHFHYNKSMCSDLGNSSINQSSIVAMVQPYSAGLWTGITFLSQVVPALFSLFVGPWSDYNGRKLILVIPALGYFFKYMLLFVFCFFPKLGPEYLFACVLPVALSGGMVNFISAVFAYVSDISQEEDQSSRISVIESVIYLGSIIGLLSISYIFKPDGIHGYKLIYGICAAVIILATIPTHFFVPESVQATERGKGLSHIFEIKLLTEMFKVCFKRREGWKRIVIFLVMITMTVSISCGLGESNVLFLFTKLRFGWDIREFTLWAFVSLAIGFLGVVCGTVLLLKGLKVPDATMGILTFGMKAAGSFYIAFIPSDAPQMMFYSGLISFFGGLCNAVGRALLSKSIPKEDLGKIFGLIGATESTIPLAVAPLYTALYGATIETLPSAFLLLSGSFFTLCCVFYIVIHFTTKKSNQREYERMENENENQDQSETENGNENTTTVDSY